MANSLSTNLNAEALLRLRLYRLQAVFAFKGTYMSAPAGYTTVSASNLKDATGTNVSNATICFQPVLSDGTPTSFRSGGTEGQTISTPVTATVVNGAFTCVLADCTLTTPANVAFATTVIDNLTGKSLLGSGYLIQPSGSTWSFDSYVPNLAPQVSVIVGGEGPAGPPLTPKGSFSGTATYAKGDVVSINGGSYISLVDSNTGNPPATSTSQWQILALKGDAGTDGVDGTVWERRVLRTVKVEGLQLRDDYEIFSDVGAGNVERIQIQYASSPGVGASSETTLLSLIVDGVKYTMALGIFMLTYGYEDGDPSNDCFATDNLGFNKGTGYTFFRRIFIPYKYSCRIALTYVAANIPAAYNAATTYASGSRAQYNGKTWVSQSGDAAGHTPGVTGSWYQEYAQLFSQVEYRHGAVPAGLYPSTRSTFRCFSTTALRDSSLPMLSTLDVVDSLTGAGELDSFFLAMKAPTSDGASHLEGNPTITADGVSNAFGGTEDFFGGGWYAWAKQRASDWGIARNGLSADGASAYWGCYRFWDGRMRYPFSSSLSISWPVGQGGESGSGWSIQAQGHVVAYTQAAYPAANPSAFPLCLDYTAANLPGLSDGDRVTSWADTAGAGGAALASTTSFGYPVYHATGLNGHPTVYVNKGAGYGIYNLTAPIPHPHSDGFERTWLFVLKNYLGSADFGSNICSTAGFAFGRPLIVSDTDTYLTDFPNARLTGVGQGVPVAFAMTTSNSREKRFAMISNGTTFASDALFGGADSTFGAYANGMSIGTDTNFGTATADIACIRCYEGAADPETCKALLNAAMTEFGLIS